MGNVGTVQDLAYGATRLYTRSCYHASGACWDRSSGLSPDLQICTDQNSDSSKHLRRNVGHCHSSFYTDLQPSNGDPKLAGVEFQALV